MLGIASPIKGRGVEVPLLKNTFVRPKCLASCGCSVKLERCFRVPLVIIHKLKDSG